jgi:hypothetical protein
MSRGAEERKEAGIALKAVLIRQKAWRRVLMLRMGEVVQRRKKRSLEVMMSRSCDNE